MKRRFVLLGMLIIMLALVGCSTEYSEDNKVVTATWEEDGRVLYVREYTKWKTVYNPLSQNCVVIADTFYLDRCNVDGGAKEEVMTLTGQLGGWSAISINSGGEWCVIGMMGGYARMYLIKTDGSEKDSIIDSTGLNLYPDISPDGSKIVYAKKGQGIWIMNRDGSGDHQIVDDTTASYPAWSPDDTLIAYGEYLDGYKTIIYNLWRDTIDKKLNNIYYPDWVNSDEIVGVYLSPNYDGCITININDIAEIDTLPFSSGSYIKGSYMGNYFIAYDGSWFVIKKDGTDKHYIEP